MKIVRLLFCLILFIQIGCETDKRFPPKGYIPNNPVETDKLEAQYFWIPQNTLKSSYWKDASFVNLGIIDRSTGNLYDDGILNATGTFSGVSGFNDGNTPELKLKAGYDNEYLYLLIEWKDTTLNADYLNWFWNGPDDILKNDSTTGWTQQKNSDNISVLFRHEDNSFDVWHWNLATTAPFNIAETYNVDDERLFSSALTTVNSENESPRTGPKYEWNGQRQEITLSDGTIQIADPARYLLEEYKQLFVGNVIAGQSVFNSRADCKFCHGPDGNGIPDGYTNGGPLNLPFINRYSRDGLAEYIGSSGHEGSGSQYWGRIKNNQQDIDNLVAFMRSVSGIPGQILSMPDMNTFVHATSNISIGRIDEDNSMYKLLLRRKLFTENSSEIQFDTQFSYSLSLQLSDNDEINYVGTKEIELVFKSNEL